MAPRRIFFGMDSLIGLHRAADANTMDLKGNDYTRLPVIENYDYLRSIHVPHGVFLSNKIISSRTDRFSHFSDESDVHEDPTYLNSFAKHHYSAAASGSVPPSLPASPTLSSPREYHPLAAPLPRLGNQRVSLPPITSLGHSAQRPVLPHSHHSPQSSTQYTPISSEDRRVLDRFRVVL